MDWLGGAPEPAAAWNRREVCDRARASGAAFTVTVMATGNCFAVESEMGTVPIYVPGVRPAGFTVTLTEVIWSGGAVPFAGATLSQLSAPALAENEAGWLVALFRAIR